jgi:hypothetical protein
MKGQESGARSQGAATLLIVRIPSGIRSKRKLLAILARRLRFPQYFGWNWDALEELLGDLSWLPADQRIVIEHVDLPFGAGGENRAIYVDILRQAVAKQPARLQVVLPGETDR